MLFHPYRVSSSTSIGAWRFPLSDDANLPGTSLSLSFLIVLSRFVRDLSRRRFGFRSTRTNFFPMRLDKARRWSRYEETHRLCLPLPQESIRSLSHLLRPCFVVVRRLLYNPQIGASNVFVFTAASRDRRRNPRSENRLGSQNRMRQEYRNDMR